MMSTSHSSHTPAAHQPFEVIVDVQADQIDIRGHVNNIVYLQWVQEVAAAHWMYVSSPAMREKVAWVILRHEIDYKQSAMPGDRLFIRTWVGVAKGLSFERHTEVTRAEDERVLARARTLWCPVDASSGRPTRVSPDVRALMSAEG